MFPSAYFPKTFFAGSYFPPPGGSTFIGNIVGLRAWLAAIGSMAVSVVAIQGIENDIESIGSLKGSVVAFQGIENDVHAIKNVAVSLRIV